MIPVRAKYVPIKVGKDYLYFIQCGDDGPIKIGMARNVARRKSSLQIGNPEQLHLLGAFPADASSFVESTVHSHFDDSRIRGEWFEPTEKLLEFIEDLKKEYPNFVRS